MMKLKDFKYLICLFFVSFYLEGQNILYGVVNDTTYNMFLNDVKLIDNNGLLITTTDSTGYYSYSTSKDVVSISFVKEGYTLFSKEKFVKGEKQTIYKIVKLDKEVVVPKRKEKIIVSFE